MISFWCPTERHKDADTINFVTDQFSNHWFAMPECSMRQNIQQNSPGGSRKWRGRPHWSIPSWLRSSTRWSRTHTPGPGPPPWWWRWTGLGLRGPGQAARRSGWTWKRFSQNNDNNLASEECLIFSQGAREMWVWQTRRDLDSARTNCQVFILPFVIKLSSKWTKKLKELNMCRPL